LDCLAIDKAVLGGSQEQSPFALQSAREVIPPEWAPWTLMSAGAVVMLYSFTIPRRMGQGQP
jgi:hypothetical protein